MTGKVYNLKNVSITLNTGVVLDCTNINIARKLQVVERTAGASKKEQGVINKETRPDMTIEGFNSSSLAFNDLRPGAKITAFAVAPVAAAAAVGTVADSASFLQSDFFTIWPISEMYLGDTDTSLGESDSSKWKTQLLCGIVASNLVP